MLITHWIENDGLSMDALRIDSTVVLSTIHPPSDSSLLYDGIRVLSRMMAKCKEDLGVKLRFTNQRKRAKSLEFRIFYAKNAEKQELYPELLGCANIVNKQVNRAIETVRLAKCKAELAQHWIKEVEHFRSLLLRVVDQTQRRIYNGETVPASEKIFSLFEEHTDIIVKGERDVVYGHKVNLATQKDGFITYLTIEDGNPADSTLYLPVLTAYQKHYRTVPATVVADGGYASKANVAAARQMEVKRTVFNKPAGLSLLDMGVKKKTFRLWRNFRAGIEGNISELKRSFGAGKAKWKYKCGLDAFVWSSVLSYSLMRMVRFSSA